MLALYIHWPFCISKCPYCDFNSHVSDSVNHKSWKSALLTELRYYAEKTQNQQLESIFFGGGTPSLMNPETVQSLIEEAYRLWPCTPNLEITLEANPGTVDFTKFHQFAKAGINRLSLGVQSLYDEQLKFLGRKHSASEARKAINMARDNFPRYSFDLIYARPNQTLKDWERELNEALTLADGHLSLYQLTIEPGTAFYTQHKRRDFHIPPDNHAADLYNLTGEIMLNAGLPSYEISNYAAPGQESRHNMMYWRYNDYIGIGPGAHGRITLNGKKRATKAIRGPETWLKAVKESGHGLQSNNVIETSEQIQEHLMMGLRLNEGIALSDFADRHGVSLESTISKNKAQMLIQEDYISLDKNTLKLTPKGRLCLDAILVELASRA